MSEEPEKRGDVVWHASEEDGPPDVGTHLAIGGGVTLWFGEISRTAWAEAGDAAASLGSDGGWWIILYGPSAERRVLGKCVDAFSAREAVDILSSALRGAA